MPSRTELDVLPRYVYAITATLIVTFIVFSVFVFQQGTRARRVEQQLTSVHLPTIANVNRVLLDLQIIESDLALQNVSFNVKKGEAVALSSHDHSSVDYSAHLFVINTQMDKINASTKLLEETTFQLLSERLFRQFADVQKVFTTSLELPLSPDRVAKTRDALTRYEHTLNQLRRLHQREAELMSRTLARQYAQNRAFIPFFGLIILLTAAVIVTRIIFLVRHTVKQQKLLETELKEHREHLELLVAKRTAELEASNKELEAYSYSIAHDLRTPLRAITSFTQIVLEDAREKLSDDERSSLERVVGAGKHMAQLIDDILKLARVTREDIRMEWVGLSELANEILAALREYEPDREVEIAIEEHLSAEASKPLISLMLANLFGNAWKFTRESAAAQIAFGAKRDEQRTIYYVRDNGVGFDMRYADKVFDPFQRLHGPQEYEGTGIGLAIVKRIIHRHHGEIWVESAPGKGTTCYFTLPRGLAAVL